MEQGIWAVCLNPFNGFNPGPGPARPAGRAFLRKASSSEVASSTPVLLSQTAWPKVSSVKHVFVLGSRVLSGVYEGSDSRCTVSIPVFGVGGLVQSSILFEGLSGKAVGARHSVLSDSPMSAMSGVSKRRSGSVLGLVAV